MKTIALLTLAISSFVSTSPIDWTSSDWNPIDNWKVNPITGPRLEELERGRRAKSKASLKSIAATAAGAPQLSTLLAAVKAAGLAETLSGKGTFTVFAPTNAAFDKLPAGTVTTLVQPENKDQLTAILLRHVLGTKIKAGQIPKGTTDVKTVGGEDISIINNGDGVSIKSSAGTAKVIATDILASNGVVHLVDTVF